MQLSEWLSYLEQVHPKTMDFGLDRVSTVRDRLGIEFDCPVFTVGGTNGKGSTCAFLECILQQSGYRVGLHTSPHLLDFNERARLDGVPARDDDLIREFEAVEAARLAPTPISLTYFEFTLLAILRLFQRENLDAVILEVGLGGRLDAVNCIDADCAIVTSIDLDHMEYLGGTRDQIALEKAHIYRTGRPAICSDPRPPHSLLDYAREIGADLRVSGRDFNYSGDRQQWAYGGRQWRRAGLAYPALRGANQLLNASGVLAALEAMQSRLPVTAQAIRNGFALVELPGRFQVLAGKPTLVLDVAHNPHAASALANNLDAMGFHRYTYAVFGCMRDKDVPGIFARLGQRVDHWYLTGLPGPRAASAQELMDWLLASGFQPDDEHRVLCFPDPASALAQARVDAGADDRICAFGSFLTVAGVLQVLASERQPR